MLSPSTAGVDRIEKMMIYARERVSHVWHVDPLAQSLEVFRLDETTYRVSMWRGDVSVAAESIDAVPVELGALWAR